MALVVSPPLQNLGPAPSGRGVVVRAGGGVVVRSSETSELQVALVHRPSRQDWSFPKGKVEPGETVEDCARREVLEETGFWCRLLSFVGSTTYRDRRGRPKQVDYWAMEPLAGAFIPSDEVDVLEWLSVDAAGARLTQDRDRDLLGLALAGLLARSG